MAFRCMHQIQAVTLYIQAAYDTVWRAGLLRELAEAGVEGYLVQWTQCYAPAEWCGVAQYMGREGRSSPK